MIHNILIEVLTSIAENERNMIKQRQAEGLAVMPKDKAIGKKKSSKINCVIDRPEIEYPSNWNEVYSQWKEGTLKKK